MSVVVAAVGGAAARGAFTLGLPVGSAWAVVAWALELALRMLAQVAASASDPEPKLDSPATAATATMTDLWETA